MTPVGVKSTQIAEQARLPQLLDAGVADAAPALPKLACEAGTTATQAAYPDTSWFCTRGDGTKHGPFFTLHPDHKVAIEGSYKAGVLDGAWRRFHPSGAVAETGTYVDGQRDGIWQQLRGNGAKLGEYTLVRGTGTSKRWLDDGTLYSEVAVKDGVPHGQLKIYEGNVVVVSARLAMGKLDGKHVVCCKNTLRVEDTYVRGTRRGTRKIWQFWALIIDEAYDTKGRLDGSFAIWRGRNTPRVQGTYAHGKRTGTWTWTDKNNKTERQGDYVDGKQDGTWTEWLDGTLFFEGTYTAGKPDGDLVYYAKDGSELGRFTITAGTGTLVAYHANRKPSSKTQLKNGLKDGKHEELTPRGKTIIEGRYASDKKHGLWREHTEAGVPIVEETYKRGKLDGVFKKFSGGVVSVEATYKDGLADGPYTEYRGGKKSLVGQFVSDKRDGTWTAYDLDGAVTLVATYKHGVLDGPWRRLAAGVVIEGQMRNGHRAGTWVQTDRAGGKTSVTLPTP